MAKKGIIYETLNEVKTLTIKKDDGLMHLSGVFGVCGIRNNNQRVYETSNYKKMVESMQERLKKAPIPGELEHPQTMNITTENISHRIDAISIDEKGVVSGEITLLNTPKGKIAQAIVEGGLPLFISSRAQGQVDKYGNVKLENLQTYDLVGSPGFSQAELHLNENQCYESICESICFIGDKEDEPASNQKVNEDQNMNNEELKKLLEEVAELKAQTEYLTEQNALLQEQIDEKEDIDLKQLAEGIQNWIINEYSPTLQSWITEEYSDKLQNWVVEDFTPEVQKWVNEEYSDKLQNWIVEDLAPEIEKWVTEEYAPENSKMVSESIQKWVADKYSDKLETWLNENFEKKGTKLGLVDKVLEMLEERPIQKPAYGRKAAMDNTPKYIAEMPADIRVKYDLASDHVKESIARKAKIYDWSKQNAIANFWESVNFDEPAVKPLNEDLKDITDERERAIRESIRAWRRR